MGRRLRELLTADEGATLVEYALIVGLLAMAILAGINSAGGVIKKSFNDIGNAVNNA